MIDADLLAAFRMFLGEPALRLLEDPEVSEIYCNPDLVLRSDGAGGRRRHPAVLDAERLMGFLRGVAHDAGQALDSLHPIGDFKLPTAMGGGRLHTKIPPVVSAPTFHLRKSPAVLYLLPELVARGFLSPEAASYLTAQLAGRKGLLIAGPTNSGKTNFLNALLDVVVRTSVPEPRFVVLEDVPEIVCPADDTLVARTTDTVSLWDLVRSTMRSSPDRIVVGEIRGAEAFPFLDIASSGHPGVLATVHAETPRGALHRLNRLARRADSELPDQFELIAEVIHVVVCLTGGSQGRRVSEIAHVDGWSRDLGFQLSLPVLPGKP
ncbi:MAG TPA: ATPase, T2SS/T4P/T4SS family [Thermoanaerobaculia bacterium]|nr:ATPase, T2SS/T4P/T4SS family [Thermoanaerobaculia bacterium]